MKEIEISQITEVVRSLCIEANFSINSDVVSKIEEFLQTEESPLAKEILEIILINHRLAREKQMPICQDTGVAIVFVELGQDVHIVGGNFYDAIQEGVRRGYRDGYLRKSIVDDPVFRRVNTKDNTPALIYTDIVPGEFLRITVAPKGAGAENMSEVRMMRPADGIEEIKEFVVDRIRRSGGNPCPPVVVGVGIGGSFEHCALLAKKALLRPLTEKNPKTEWAEVESDILQRINRLGIGPMGIGGRTTALAVQILYKPCHMASLPVAVNVQCHAHRHKTAII